MPMVQHMMLECMKSIPNTVAIGLIRLSRQMVKSSDSILVTKFTRTYFRFQKDLEKNCFAIEESDFEAVYDEICNFIGEFPRTHPLLKDSNKMDILRCHVTFLKKMTRAHRNIAQIVLSTKPPSTVYDCVKKELNSSSEGKENETSSALKAELERLLNKSSVKETSKAGLLGIFEFKKRNPNYDINIVLGSKSEYFKRYVEKHLAIYAKRDAGKLNQSDLELI